MCSGAVDANCRSCGHICECTACRMAAFLCNWRWHRLRAECCSCILRAWHPVYSAGSCNVAPHLTDWSLQVCSPRLSSVPSQPVRIVMLGRCGSASCAPGPSTFAPRPFVSLAPAARPQQQQQLRPCGGPQHRPATATVVAAASRGGGGRGSSAGRSSSTTGRGRGMSAAGGINAKELNSSISGCSDAEALMQLVERHAASFDFIHASTALTRAAKLMEAPLSADEEDCIAQLTCAAGRQLEECGAWALANMAWALAKLDYRDTAFMQRLVRQAGIHLSRFEAQGTANTLWALARQGYHDKAFTAQLLTHARSQDVKQDFSSQNLSNILWAMAKLQHVAEDRQLVQELLECAQPQLPQFSQQALANTAWALATLRHYDLGFMEQLLQQSMAKVAGFDPQHISNTLWALANLSHNNPVFVDGALRRLLALETGEITERITSNVLWALSMLQHDATAVVTPLIAAAAAHFKAVESSLGKIDTELQHLCQVHQYLVTMEGAGRVSKQLQASSQYKHLRRNCQAAFVQRSAQLRSSPLSFMTTLLPAVRQLPGCSAAQAVQVTEDQDVEMNMGLTLPCGTKVAVEVASQTACMANSPDKPLGPLLWKRQQLAARGFKVVVIMEADWLEVGPEMQQMYLRMRFREAGLVLPAK